MTTMRAWAVLVVASAAAIFACGPSFQVIYEGDARFEHCYALDDDPQLAMQTKAACWQDWVKNYRYGQTRNRVDYANLRYHALSRGNSMPTDDALMGAAPGKRRGPRGCRRPPRPTPSRLLRRRSPKTLACRRRPKPPGWSQSPRPRRRRPTRPEKKTSSCRSRAAPTAAPTPGRAARGRARAPRARVRFATRRTGVA